jgi:hypothetical protein
MYLVWTGSNSTGGMQIPFIDLDWWHFDLNLSVLTG